MKDIEIQHHSMVITLDETDSNQVPEEVWEATAITELKIQKTQPASQWKTYPPLSWYETRNIEPPYWTFSNNIGRLVNLKSLYLIDLDLASLPASIVQLQKLEILNVSLNKLDLSNELEKFKKLKKLRHLILLGNHFDEAIMLAFKKELQYLKVEYRDEDEQRNTTDGIYIP